MKKTPVYRLKKHHVKSLKDNSFYAHFEVMCHKILLETVEAFCLDTDLTIVLSEQMGELYVYPVVTEYYEIDTNLDVLLGVDGLKIYTPSKIGARLSKEARFFLKTKLSTALGNFFVMA